MAKNKPVEDQEQEQQDMVEKAPTMREIFTPMLENLKPIVELGNMVKQLEDAKVIDFATVSLIRRDLDPVVRKVLDIQPTPQPVQSVQPQQQHYQPAQSPSIPPYQPRPPYA